MFAALHFSANLSVPVRRFEKDEKENTQMNASRMISGFGAVSRHRTHQPSGHNPGSASARRATDQKSSSWLLPILAVALLAVSLSALWLAPAVSASGAAATVPVFGREVIVAHQR